MEREVQFSALLGKTLVLIENKDNKYMSFETVDGQKFALYHRDASYGNDASADIEDIVGSLEDLLHNPILVAEVRSNNDAPKRKDDADMGDWYTTRWTFYEIATIKGSVTLRWYSSASPHYSVEVDFFQIK